MTKDKLTHTDEGLQIPNKELSQSHYSVPEGYFDMLEDKIMLAIDQEIEHELPTPPVSLWTKLKPSLYLVATFVSVYFSFKLLVPSDTRGTIPAPNNIAQLEASDDDYNVYYESYASEVTLQEEGEELLALMQ